MTIERSRAVLRFKSTELSVVYGRSASIAPPCAPSLRIEESYCSNYGIKTIYWRRARPKASLWSEFAIGQTLSVTTLSGLMFRLSTEISAMTDYQRDHVVLRLR